MNVDNTQERIFDGETYEHFFKIVIAAGCLFGLVVVALAHAWGAL